ncbi:unnamed protein product [Discula destructiva]
MSIQKEAEKGVFDQSAIAFIVSRELSQDMVDTLRDVVERHSGEIVERDEHGKLDVANCTHIVACTIDFPEYNEAMAMMVPVVKGAWITVSLRRNRQAQIRPYSPDPRLIFSDVNFTCEDLPIEDREALTGAVLALGGTESKDLGRLTTHICALSTEGPKCRMAHQKNLKCKVVLPHWFDDCLRLGKRIDEAPYELPDPEILRANPDDKVDIPASQHLDGATSAQPDQPPFQPGTRQKLTVFKHKKVCLSRDLALSEALRKTLNFLITSGGGTSVDSAEDCDWFVCQYRDGGEYIRAAQHGKQVGSLAWLYHIIYRNEWTDPMRRLLHYPVPKSGMEGFKGLRITVSNYGGEARTYLQNLLRAAGAEVTGAMRQDNTHLITARKAGDKCEAAEDWNLPMVNHLWVEESYAQCELQPLTKPKYTVFPPRTNLGEVIGTTWLDESKLEALYYPGGDENLRMVPVLARQNAQTHGPAAGLVIGRQKHREFDIMQDGEEEYAEKTIKKFGVAAPPRANDKAQAAATPVRPRQVRAGKENGTPSMLSSVSRSAKASALNKLHTMAPDIALYEREKKRKSSGNTPFGGKRAAILIEQERQLEREKKAAEQRRSSGLADDADEEMEEEQRPAKRQKPGLPPIDMRVVVTCYQGWINDAKKESADRRKLRLLGILVVPEGTTCQYLAAPSIKRTIKFLCTLAKGPTVIDSQFIDDCLEQGKRLDVEEYHLVDKEREKQFGIKLDKSISLARQNQGKLLGGAAIYCTTAIKSGPDSYRAIAEANGAIFKTYTGRTSTIKVINPEEDSQGPEPVYLLSSSSKQERDLWPKFEKMARDGNMKPRVVTSDWLLKVAMAQEVTFEKEDLAENFFKVK